MKMMSCKSEQPYSHEIELAVVFGPDAAVALHRLQNPGRDGKRQALTLSIPANIFQMERCLNNIYGHLRTLI